MADSSGQSIPSVEDADVLSEDIAISVQIVYALPDQYFQQQCSVRPGATITEVLQVSGVYEQFGLSATTPVGVFGQRVHHPQRHQVTNGDRIELYRPLIADPKSRRLKRAAAYPVGKVKRPGKLAGLRRVWALASERVVPVGQPEGADVAVSSESLPNP